MELKELIIQLIKTGATISDKLNKKIKTEGVSLPQFNVLRILRGHKDGNVNLFMVQQRMVNRMSNTTRLIDKLIEKNLVKREICTDNRRKIELSITQRGLDLLVKLDPLISNEEEKLMRSLTVNEKKQLFGLLDKINVNHKKVDSGL